ncbi:hypothetical protein [Mycolicibacterium septicum]|uniref:hypothetical protein n=1 Tax=Mycolicibacterium septicum TaxID=98668 RepID=UPI002362E6E0|nr:hypothetical protein [Mycolicibacterium septicum]
MSRQVQIWCVWSGPVAVLFLTIGIVMLGFLPPPSGTWNAQEIAEFWRHNVELKRTGLVMFVIGAGFTAPFASVIAAQMKRMEPERAPLTYMQLIGGGLGVLVIVYPVFMLGAVAYRPERDPEITQAMTDLAVPPFIGLTVAVSVQCVAIGAAILANRTGPQVYPRWVGYVNLWAALTFVPGALVLLFRSGPFARDGLIDFWVVAGVFGAWYVVMAVATLSAVKADEC